MGRGIVNKFNRGVIDDEATARDDIKRVNNSASIMTNFIPKRLGPMAYRPGTEHIDDITAVYHRMIPFVSSVTDTGLVEFDDTNIKFIVNDVLQQSASATSSILNQLFTSNITSWTAVTPGSTSVAWVTGGYAHLTGDGSNFAEMYQTSTSTDTGSPHTFEIVIKDAPALLKIGTSGVGSTEIFNSTLKPGTHILTFTPSGDFTFTFLNDRRYRTLIDKVELLGAGDIAITTPISSGDLTSLRYVQSGDIIFCTHRNMISNANLPFQVEHRGDKSWGIVDFRADDGPFEIINLSAITIAPSALFGDVTLSASDDLFEAEHVGALFRIASNGQKVNATVSVDTGAGTNAIRVFGVGATRAFVIDISGIIASAIVTLQRSGDDEATWDDVTTYTADQATLTYNDGFDNSIYHYRLYIKSGDNPLAGSGAHDGADNASVLTDSGEAWTVNEHVGLTITNTTDGSSGTITANSSTTVTATLTGGAEDDWDIGDSYTISRDSVSLDLDYGAGSIEGIARVTAYTNATTVIAQVLVDFGSTDATKDWYEGSWSDKRGHPTAVELTEGRLWFGGEDEQWGSVSDSYYSFTRDIEGDSASIHRTIGFGPSDPIKWLKAAGVFVAATSADEISIRSSSFGEVITPSNANLKSGSSQGSDDNNEPVKVDDLIYFVQRSRTKLYSLEGSSDVDKFSTNDINILNQSITSSKIRRLMVSRQPETRIWVLLENGDLAVYTVDVTEDSKAWSLVDMVDDAGTTIIDICVLPGEVEDVLYLITTRGTTYSIEKMAQFAECKGASINKTFDGAVYYTSPGTTLTGLGHLNGKTAGVWADGQDRGDVAVSGGQATVASSWTNVVVGMRYTADYKSSKLQGYVKGSVLVERKRIVDTGLILANYWPGSIKVGPTEALLKDLPGIEDGKAAQTTETIDYTELPFEFDGEDEVDPRILIRATGPCTIMALTYDIANTEPASPSDYQG